MRQHRWRKRKESPQLCTNITHHSVTKGLIITPLPSHFSHCPHHGVQRKYIEVELCLPFGQHKHTKNQKCRAPYGALSPACLSWCAHVVETLGQQLLRRRRRREELQFHCQHAVPLAPMGLRLTRVGSGSQTEQQL